MANSPRLKEIISQQKPDAIIVSLGMNEMLERNPQRRLEKPVDKLLAEFGDMPLLWIAASFVAGKRTPTNSTTGCNRPSGRRGISTATTLKSDDKANQTPTPQETE